MEGKEFGLWHAPGIVERADLNWTQKALLAKIDALSHDRKHPEDGTARGCYAQNAFLAQTIHCSPNHIT